MTKYKIFLIVLFCLFYQNIFCQISDFSVDKDPAEYCLSDTVSFMNNSSSYTHQKWDFGDNYITYFENSQHIYQNEGLYTVTLTVYNADGDSAKHSEIITILAAPTLKLTPENDTTISAGSGLTITATGNYNEILWSNGKTSDEITVTLEGIYSVIVTENTNYCTNKDTIVVSVSYLSDNERTEIQVLNNILTPNNDGINDYLIIEKLNEFEFACEIFIYNTSGQLIYSDSNYQNNWNGKLINGKKLSSGTYYYLLKSENRKSKTGFVDIIGY